MTEIRFYHLQTQTPEQALPVILLKSLAAGKRTVLRLPNEQSVHHFDEHLWTYNPDSFLPHGTATDKRARLQPVYLTDKTENPNQADMILLCQMQTVPENIADFALCCDFLDGRDEESVAAGRTRWKFYKENGHAVTYWQQTDTGGWEQKT